MRCSTRRGRVSGAGGTAAWLTWHSRWRGVVHGPGRGAGMRELAGVLPWAERGVAVRCRRRRRCRTRGRGCALSGCGCCLEGGGVHRPTGAVGAWWRGLWLVSLDSTTLDAQDEEANWQRFGGPSTKTPDGKRLRGAFPQVRLVALAECGTRALVAAVRGSVQHG